MPADQAGARLRLARLARGISQVELARVAGVTRQAIAGVESGRWDPSLKVALSIAAALHASVEELFGPEPELQAVEAEILNVADSPFPDQPLARARLARVGGRHVAAQLEGEAAVEWGFREASGVWDSATGLVQPISEVQPTVVVAGCDPALPLLAGPLASLRTPFRLLAVRCSSERALDLLRQGRVHVAGVHLLDPATGAYNRPQAQAALSGMEAELVGFAIWKEGLAVHPDFADTVHDIADAVTHRVPVVNREKGSEARNLLERELSRCGIGQEVVSGFDGIVNGHLAVASAIRAQLAGAGITNEAAAATYGLAFNPVVTERYDLVVTRPMLDLPEAHALLSVLGTSAFRRQIETLPGYDAGICGEIAELG